MLAVMSRAESDLADVDDDDLDGAAAGANNRPEAVARGRALLARLPSGEEIAARLISRLVEEQAN